MDFFGQNAKVIHNLYITNSKGYTNIIKELFITSRGIFVVDSDRPKWQSIKDIKFMRDLLNMRVWFHTAAEGDELENEFRKAWDEGKDVLSDEDIEFIYERLMPLTNRDKEAREKYFKSMTRRIAQTEICPLCGKKLVTRTAKNGPNAGKEFIGCTGYPQCDFTRRLK